MKGYARWIFIWISFFKAVLYSNFLLIQPPWIARLKNKTPTTGTEHIPLALFHFLLVETTSPSKQALSAWLMIGVFVFVFLIKWSARPKCIYFLSLMHEAHLPNGTQVNLRDVFAPKIAPSVSRCLPLLFPSELQNYDSSSSGGGLHMHHMKKELIKCTLEI